MSDKATRIIEHPPLSDAAIARSERIMELLSLPDTEPADSDEIARSLAFIPDRLASMAAPPTDAERADLERRLKDALWADYSAADWMAPRFLNHEGKPKFALIPTAAAYERVWSAVVRSWLMDHAPAMAVRDQLRGAADEGSARAKAPHVFDVLMSDVRVRWKGLVEVIETAADETITARVADWLEKCQLPQGAAYVRGERWSDDRWADLLFAARILARLTWIDETERKMSLAWHPAISLPLVDLLALTRHAQKALPLDGENSWSLVVAKGSAPTRTIGRVAEIDDRLMSRLEGATLLRLFLFMVNTVHRQRITRAMWNQPDRLTDNVDRLLLEEGGWSGLAGELGLAANMGGQVRDAADVFESIRLDVQGEKDARLFLWEPMAQVEKTRLRGAAHSGRSAGLMLEVLGPLASYYVVTLDRKHDRSLVPVPAPECAPPLKGRKNDHGGLLMLQLLLMRTFRKQAEMLATAGGIVITPAEWLRLLDEAKLRRSILPTVQESWRAGYRGAPPMLKDTPGGLLDLTDSYDNPRRFIIESVADGKAKAEQAARQARLPGRSRRGRG